MTIVPSIKQQIASSPEFSVITRANAGTGKTKVLVSRVLRLFLQNIPPSKILCLTYTKPAAGEMINRINSTLKSWLKLSDDELSREIKELTGEIPSDEVLLRARTLYVKIVDSYSDIRIQTIHSFAQDILKRFPLEIGIPPYFQVLEESDSLHLLNEAKQLLFDKSANDEGLDEAVIYILEELGDSIFGDIISEIRKQKWKFSDITCDESFSDAALNEFATKIASTRNDEELRSLAAAALTSPKQRDTKLGNAILAWLHGERDIEAFFEYYDWFVNNEFKPKKDLLTVDVKKRFPEKEVIARLEQDRVIGLMDEYKKIRQAEIANAVYVLAKHYLQIYDELKQSHAYLDYDDMIRYTKSLLSNRSATEWVLYKLCEGIDHVLIDEAQDTSSSQWQIIMSLIEDYFAGESIRPDTNRTLFVVGDEKQSIFSFQGANPYKLDEVARSVAMKAQSAQIAYREVALDLSYRSSAAVLEFVDRIFDHQEIRSNIGASSYIKHLTSRMGDAGRVELWPIEEGKKAENHNSWRKREMNEISYSSSFLLAEKIVTTIALWLKEGRILESKGRPVTSGDILILVRKRGPIVYQLNRLLKKANIPTSGQDRLKLSDHIAVQDLVSLGNFLLLPEDSLSLAEVLKSPLFGLNDDDLFALCHKRKTSLWESLAGNQKYSAVYKELKELLSVVDYFSPYEIYAEVLGNCDGRKKFMSRLGEEALEPLDEFLNLLLKYEVGHVPSLQSFLHWFQLSENEIKRDLEHGGGKLRIMTVHGAKGLQAPIVIMPDTTFKIQIDDRLFLDGRGKLVYKTPKDERDSDTEAVYEAEKSLQYSEHLRLLYVALTRAEDEVYIGGHSNTKLPEECWYKFCEKAISEIGNLNQDGGFVYEKPQEKVVVKKQMHNESGEYNELPEYFNSPYMGVKEKAKVKASEREVSNEAVKFGRAVHKILEVVSIEQGDKNELIDKLAVKFGIVDGLWLDNIRRFFAVDRKELLGEEIYTELSIIGEIDGEIISCRIDRLVVTETEVRIIDYKTDANPPTNGKVPDDYREQLCKYARLIARIYPEKSVKCLILWLLSMRFTEVDVDNLAMG